MINKKRFNDGNKGIYSNLHCVVFLLVLNSTDL